VEDGRGGVEEGAAGAGVAAGDCGGEERMVVAKSVALTSRREAHSLALSYISPWEHLMCLTCMEY
jgi:hypothetical protein